MYNPIKRIFDTCWQYMFLRYTFVSGIQFIISLLVYFYFSDILGYLAWVVATVWTPMIWVVRYFLNKKYIFTDGKEEVKNSFWRYIFVNVSQFLLSLLILGYFSDTLGIMAVIVTLVWVPVAWVFRFFIVKKWVFRVK